MPRHETTIPTEVDVTIDVGAVHVIADAHDRTSVTVNPADPDRREDVQLAERAEVEVSDGRLVIRATEPRRLGRLVGPGSTTGAVDLVVEVPEGIELRVTGQVADVRVDGRIGAARIRTQIGAIALDRTGDVTARTSGGDVTIRHVEGQARVQGLGTIRLDHLSGPAEVKNLTGPVEIASATGSLRLRSSTGDLQVGSAAADVVARTAGGAVTVGTVTEGLIDLRTSGGSIRVGVAEGTSVLLDATTKLGRVEQQLERTDGPATDRRVEIRAHTAMGDVVIHRA